MYNLSKQDNEDTLCFRNMSCNSNILIINPSLLKEWRDDRLMWDPEKFGDIKDIIIKADKIWLPEIAVMNGYVGINYLYNGAHIWLVSRFLWGQSTYTYTRYNS